MIVALIGADTSRTRKAELDPKLKRYLTTLRRNPQDVTDLRSLRDFTQRDHRELFPRVDTDKWDAILAEEQLEIGSEEYADELAKDNYAGGEASLTGALDRYQLDALLMPPEACIWLTSIARSPAICVPIGAKGVDAPFQPARKLPFAGETIWHGPNQPFGLVFIARPFDEYKLLAVAHAFEQATLARDKVKPIVCPSFQLADVL